MKVLDIEDNLSLGGVAVQLTGKITFADGRTVWVCDVWEDLVEALAIGDMFMAHEVVAVMPQELIVNPHFVASVQSEPRR